MGTQGVVSLVKDGATVIKGVAGCGGQEAETLAGIIATHHLSTVDGIYLAALATPPPPPRLSPHQLDGVAAACGINCHAFS